MDLVYVAQTGNGSGGDAMEPRLLQSSPNPMHDTAVIRFEIPGRSGDSVPVQLLLYDIAGRRVAVLVDQLAEPGIHAVRLEASGVGIASGLYFYRLKIDGRVVQSRKLLLSR